MDSDTVKSWPMTGQWALVPTVGGESKDLGAVPPEFAGGMSACWALAAAGAAAGSGSCAGATSAAVLEPSVVDEASSPQPTEVTAPKRAAMNQNDRVAMSPPRAPRIAR